MADRHTRGYDGDRFKGERFGTLWYHEGSGEADITIKKDFDDLPITLKMDLMNDWMAMLEREYVAVSAELDSWLAAIRNKEGQSNVIVFRKP